MNTEGKKVHCLPDPERVLTSQTQVEVKYRQNFEKWVSNVNDMRNFDAAAVISSLATTQDKEMAIKDDTKLNLNLESAVKEAHDGEQ